MRNFPPVHSAQQLVRNSIEVPAHPQLEASLQNRSCDHSTTSARVPTQPHSTIKAMSIDHPIDCSPHACTPTILRSHKKRKADAIAKSTSDQILHDTIDAKCQPNLDAEDTTAKKAKKPRLAEKEASPERVEENEFQNFRPMEGLFSDCPGNCISWHPLVQISHKAKDALVSRGLSKNKDPINVVTKQNYPEIDQYFLVPLREKFEKGNLSENPKKPALENRQRQLQQELNDLFPERPTESDLDPMHTDAQTSGAIDYSLGHPARNGADLMRSYLKESPDILSLEQFEEVARKVYKYSKKFKKAHEAILDALPKSDAEADANYIEMSKRFGKIVPVSVWDTYFTLIEDAYDIDRSIHEDAILNWLWKVRNLILEMEAVC